MIEDNLLSLSYGRIVRKDIADNDGLLPQSFETYQIVEPNDLVWRLTDLQNDKRSLRTALAEERGIITSAYLATTPTGVDPRFFAYLLRGYDLQKVFYSMGGGLRQSMKFADVKRLPILLPPTHEQAALSGFLDRETARIDALVEEQCRLIELLKEKRQAVISHAVTKGLDPSVPMKDSGVEWLGDVPAHWNVLPLKYLARIGNGSTPNRERAAYWDGGSFPWLNSGVVNQAAVTSADQFVTELALNECHLPVVKPPAVLVGITGQGRTRGMATRLLMEATVNQHVAYVKPNEERLDCSFLLRFFEAVHDQLRAASEVGSTKGAITCGDLENFKIPLPPIGEQVTIGAQLRTRCDHLDQLLAAAEAATQLLNERRAALISAAVTGKIDVRGWTASDVRKAVTAEIISLHARKPTFGRVKNQKLLYLAEAHAGIGEIGGRYERHAAGPYDSALISIVERELEAAGVITVSQPDGRGSAVRYSINRGWKPNRALVRDMLGDRLAAFEQLNANFADLDTRDSEAVATLYAVWNDALIDGLAPTDEEIVSRFLNEWHPEKQQKFRARELHTWLGWMRRHGLVPRGQAPKTTTGRLFV